MQRKVVITLDIDDTAHDGSAFTTEDIRDSFLARLDEIPGMDVAVPENVRVSVMNAEAVDTLLSAAEVGLEGVEDDGEWDDLDVTHAWQVVSDLRGRA